MYEKGLILGQILFNIFPCDLFHFLKGIDIATYAANTTPYSDAETQKDASTLLFKWFSKI